MGSFGESELLIALIEAFGGPRPVSFGLGELQNDLINAINLASGGFFVNPVLLGADPLGIVDSTSAFDEAMDKAVSTSGVVWTPPGTYICNHAKSPAQGTGYLLMMAAGEGAVTLVASEDTFATLEIRMPGEVWDQTISGGGFKISGAPLIMRNTDGAGTYYPVSRLAARRVTCTDIAANSNWLLYMGDPTSAAIPLVDEIITDDVTLLGPSATGQDACTITYGRRYVAEGYFRMIGCSRSPNVYGPQSTKMVNVQIDITSANATGNPIFVLDGPPSTVGQLSTAVADTDTLAPPIWRKDFAVSAGATVQPTLAATQTTGNSVGYYYILTTPGTTGATEPSWPATPTNAQTVSDGTAVWTWNTGQTVSLVTSFPGVTGDARYPDNPQPNGIQILLPINTVLNVSSQGGPFTGWGSSAGVNGTNQKPVLSTGQFAGGSSLAVNGFYPVDGGFTLATLVQAYLPLTQEVVNIEATDTVYLDTGQPAAVGHIHLNGAFVTVGNIKMPTNGIGYAVFNVPDVFNQQARISGGFLDSGIEVSGNGMIGLGNLHCGTRLAGMPGAAHHCIGVDGGVTATITSSNVDYDGGTDNFDSTSPLVLLGTSETDVTLRARGGSFANITTNISTGSGTFNPDIQGVAGYNPVGSNIPGTAFATWAYGTAQTNNTGVRGTLFCTAAAGTTTGVIVNGVNIGSTLAAGQAFPLDVGSTFEVTGSGTAPTFDFVGD